MGQLNLVGCDPVYLSGKALKAYVQKRLPSFRKDQGHGSKVARNRVLNEVMIWLLPLQKGCEPCRFLLRLLKTVARLENMERKRENS